MWLLRADDSSDDRANIDADSQVEIAKGMVVEILQLGEQCQSKVYNGNNVGCARIGASQSWGCHVSCGDGFDLLNALEVRVTQNLCHIKERLIIKQMH